MARLSLLTRTRRLSAVKTPKINRRKSIIKLKNRRNSIKPSAVASAAVAAGIASTSFVVEKIAPPSRKAAAAAAAVSGALVYRHRADQVYVLLMYPGSSIYMLQADLCARLKLVGCSPKWLLHCEGYTCQLNESISVSTCFGHKTFVEFMPNPFTAENTFDREQMIEENALIESEPNFLNFYSSHKTALQNGQSVLVRIDLDLTAIEKYKVVLEYLSKSHCQSARMACYLKALPFNTGTMPLLVKVCRMPDSSKTIGTKTEAVYRALELTGRDRVLVCGPSNCGKTTLLHHFMNRYISEHGTPVYYLECDPGQTEFAPCGVLSLVRVTGRTCNAPGFKYLFREQYLLHGDGIIIDSKILGTITPSGNSFDYMALIEQLVKTYNSLDQQQHPLFINTMGWVENLGLDLLVRIIEAVRPTHVVRIENQIVDPSRTICPIYQQSSLRSFTMLADLRRLLDIRPTKNFELWVSQCPLIQRVSHTPFSGSSIRRELSQLCYMVTNLWPTITFIPFFSIKPVAISMSDLHVFCVNYPSLIPKSIYDLLNLSWVFLGHIPPEEEQRLKVNGVEPSARLLKQLPRKAVCIGCGIVRNVDSQRRQIYVTMPMTAAIQQPATEKNQSQKINLLVYPNLIPIPSGVLLEQFLYQDSCNMPYVSFCDKPSAININNK